MILNLLNTEINGGMITGINAICTGIRFWDAQAKSVNIKSKINLLFFTNKVILFAKISASPQMKACFHFVQALCNDYFSLPLKGLIYSFFVNLSSIISSCSCSLIYFRIVASFRPTVLT